MKWRLRAGVYGGWLAGAALVGVYIAVPPQPPDNEAAVIGMVAWVAFLVVADAYLFIRRRHMLRPDYVALAVTLTAVVYVLSAPPHWARFTCVGLSVLTAVAALSLRAQRDLWAVRRPRPAMTPDAPDGPDATAGSPVSSPVVTPGLRNRRLVAPIAVFVVLAAGLRWRTDSVGHLPHRADGHPTLLSGAAGPTSTVDALGNRNPLCVFGETSLLGNDQSPATANSADLVVVSVVAHATGNGPAAPPPQEGEYEVATVSVTGKVGSFAYAPTLLAFMTNTGKTYTSADGNSAASGYGPALNAGTVTKGKRVTGTVTFDVPPGGGRVQLRFGIGGSACDWLVGT